MTGSFTKQRTYDRETWNRAMATWSAGRFGPEWAEWRLLASRSGIIFPPDGSPDDSWAAPRPSQRAMVIRAIRETPVLLRWALRQPGVDTWGDVIEKLLEGRDRMALEADEREHEWNAVKRSRPPVRLGETLAVVMDSLS